MAGPLTKFIERLLPRLFTFIFFLAFFFSYSSTSLGFDFASVAVSFVIDAVLSLCSRCLLLKGIDQFIHYILFRFVISPDWGS